MVQTSTTLVNKRVNKKQTIPIFTCQRFKSTCLTRNKIKKHVDDKHKTAEEHEIESHVRKIAKTVN